MSRPRKPIVFAGLLALAIGAAGCGGTGPADDELSAALENSAFSAEAMTDKLAADLGVYEGLIQTCMKEAGFGYTVRERPVATQQVPGTIPTPTAMGYGLTETALEGFELEAIREQVDAIESDELFQAMAPDERIAYAEALHGSAFDADVILRNPTPGSCRGQAAQTMADRHAASADELQGAVQLVQQTVSDIRERFRADPRAAEIDSAWTRCMADRGYPVEIRDQASGAVQQRLYQASQDSPEFTADDVEAFEALRTRLDAIEEFEIQLAQADLACGSELNAERNEILQSYFDDADPQLAEIYAG